MSRTSRIFTQGGSQAVRIPADIRFPSEVEKVECFRHPSEPSVLCLRPVDRDTHRAKANAILDSLEGLLNEWRSLPQPAQKDEAPNELHRAQKILNSM